jgi:hypothetical protein
MSKPTEVIVLCEDNRTFSFARSFLKKCRIDCLIRPLISLSGKASAFDWVVQQYPVQANAYRLAKARKHTWLIVFVDADTRPIEHRLGQLKMGLERAHEPRTREMCVEDESIARLIPRRNIETWILALNNVSVNETDDLKNTRSRDVWQALIPMASVTFYELTRLNAKWPESLIASLRHGIGEMRRVFQLAG